MFNFFKKPKQRRVAPVAWLVYVETVTRFGYVSPNGSINFQELINNCHPYVAALRAALQSFDCSEPPVGLDAEYIERIVMLADEVNSFLDKWTSSYTGWLSSFKSRSKEAKSIMYRSNEWIYEEFQSFYPNGTELYEDCSKLLTQLQCIAELSRRIVYEKEA